MNEITFIWILTLCSAFFSCIVFPIWIERRRKHKKRLMEHKRKMREQIRKMRKIRDESKIKNPSRRDS